MTATQVSAQELFRAAYENRYTWDSNFPGYTADVTYKYDDKVFTGKIRVGANLKGEVLEVEDEEAKKAIASQVWEIAIHRVRRTFEQTHGENRFKYGETDAQGNVEILIEGKTAGDKYRVRNDVVTLVYRQIHGVVVTINTFSVQETGEGYLSRTYDSVYHDPATGEQKGGKSFFVDSWQKVGNYTILCRREIKTEVEGGTSTQEFIFDNIQLLPKE